MAKRLLIFVVFCFVSVSMALGQCDKTFRISLNNNVIYEPGQTVKTNPIFVCKDNKNIFNFFSVESGSLTFKWYVNDTLVNTSQSSIFETTRDGVFRIEIKDKECDYKIGPIILAATKSIDISLSTNELTICENVKSTTSLWAFTNLLTDLDYQWQKDGKDIPNEKETYIYPSTSGIYTVRLSSDNCSATSAQAVVKAAINNKIPDYIYGNNNPIKKDSIFLCKDYSYNFEVLNGTTNWYRNGQLVVNSSNLEIKESGSYYVQRKVADNCTIQSKPLYISFGQTINPINMLDSTYSNNYCDQVAVILNDLNLRGNNKLQLTDLDTGKNGLTYKNIHDYTLAWFFSGKYAVSYETGSCKSPSTTVEFKTKLHVYNLFGGIINKKVSLCPNNSIKLRINHGTNDDVVLYRNDTIIEVKSIYFDLEFFNITQKGKYFFKITQPYCNPSQVLVSDTIEVDIQDPILTSLTLTDCTTGQVSLHAKEYAGYNYSWYRNGNLLSNESTSHLQVSKNDISNYYAILQKGLCSVVTQTTNISNQIKGNTSPCEGSKFFLEAIKDGIFSWKGPNGFTSNERLISIDNLNQQQSGWYILSTTINGCALKDSVNIKVVTKPTISFSFASPICLNQELVAKFKAEPGFYWLDYSLLGSDPQSNYFYLSNSYSLPREKYVSLGKMAPKGNKEYFNFSYSGCNFSLDIPAHATTPEICNDVFEFTNLKETYCYKQKTTLKFKLPANIPKGKKFRISIENLEEKYDLGLFSGDSAQVSIPAINNNNMYFIIEDEDAKFIAMSNEFNIRGKKPNIQALLGNTYTYNSSSTVMHCEGFPIHFTPVNTIVYGDQSMQWRKDGINIAGATKYDFEASESGLYSLLLTTEGCTAESSTIEVKEGVVPKPDISSVIGGYNACKGFSVPIIEKGYFPYTDFEWKRNDQVIEKKSNRDFFDAKESGYYKLTAYQGSCKATSDSVAIEIGEYLPNRIYAYGTTEVANNKVAICDQKKANFYTSDYYFPSPINQSDSTVAAKYGFSFQWKRNDKNIEDANSSSYESGEPGIYSLQVKQGDCIVNSNKVEVIKQNTLSVRLSNSYNYSFLNAKDTLMVCKGTGFDIYAYQQYEEMYSWNKELYKDGKLILSYSVKDNNNYNNYFNIKESGKYSIKLYPENQKSCAAYTDTSNILLVDKTFNLPLDTVFACTDSIYLYPPSVNGSFNTYQWSFKNKVISNNYYLTAPLEEGIYTLESKQSKTCSAIQPVLVQKKIEAKISLGGKNPITSMVSFCNDKDNFLYSYNVSDYTLEWYRNQQKLSDTLYSIKANQEGEYFLKVKFKDCVANSNTIKVEIPKIKNQISPIADSLALCLNGGFQNLEAVKEFGYTYEWFKDNVGIEESSSTLKANQPGTYKALIQSRDCYALTPKVKIYPSTQPPTATISGDTTLNIGDTANLKLSFSPSPPFTYKLSNNQEGTTEKNTIVHPVKVEEATIFKLTSVKNACGEGTVSGEAKIQVIILANEPLIGHKITIAPVPAESYCEIIFDLPTSQEVSYQLLDMKGQQLSEKNLGQVTYKKQYLNLNHMTAGEYLVRIQVGKEFVTRKLIKF